MSAGIVAEEGHNGGKKAEGGFRPIVLPIPDRGAMNPNSLPSCLLIQPEVERNSNRFPEDFSFMLTSEETRNLMFQIGTSSSQHGGSRKPAIVEAIRQLLASPEPEHKGEIGFHSVHR